MSILSHQFNVDVATQYGVNVATFLNNIAHWVDKNISNRANFHENTFWTYNSHPAFLEIFPYFSESQLKTIIEKCLENDLIRTGNFNIKKYDRTHWYCLTEKGLSLFGLKNKHDNAVLDKNSNKINISEKSLMHERKIADASAKNRSPIPDNKPALKPDINKSFCENRKAENEKRHDWADAKDQKAKSKPQMDRESKHIKESEIHKCSGIPPKERQEMIALGILKPINY